MYLILSVLQIRVIQFPFLFFKDKESSPEITSADKTDNKDSEEGSADEKTSTSSFITNETQRNGLTREGSSTEPNKGEQLVHDYMGSIDGVTNHIYEKPPDDYVPFFDETHQREESRLSLKDEVRDNVAEIGDERTPRNTFTQSEEEASQEGPSKDEKLVHDDRSSEDGVSNRIYENTPNEYAPSFIEMQGTDEDNLRLEQRRPSSSSSSNSEMEYVEISEEVPPVINQEEVACVVEDAPSLQGAMPSDSDDTLVSRRTAKVRCYVE